MRIKRVVQKPWLCGPATLEMLFSFYGEHVDQEKIAEATHLPPHDLCRFGYSLNVLNQSLEQLNCGYSLLVKYDSSLDELKKLSDLMPVGVEWRCIFREPDGKLWEEGHYCVVDHVDVQAGLIHIIDPYYSENLSHQQGIVTTAQFVENWWDENMIPDDHGNEVHVWTQGNMFILVPNNQIEQFKVMGFACMSNHLAINHSIAPRSMKPLSPATPFIPAHEIWKNDQSPEGIIPKKD